MIKYIITDFDGTLVNTKKANILAYKEAFKECGYVLNVSQYEGAFGLRFDSMCNALGVPDDADIRNKIKHKKAEVYPKYFSMLELNENLIQFLKLSKSNNIKIAIASTASKENLMAVLLYFGLEKMFDIIITGEMVKNGKPDPEVYNNAMNKLGCVHSQECLVFEDSSAGIESANNAGIENVIKIKL